MTDQAPHPTDTELAAYGLGQLAPEAAAAVEEHINRCEPCCETIAGYSTEDTFVELLQEARQVPTESGGTEVYGATDSGLPEVPAPLVDHPRYEVFGLIGKGGMGDVYQARHRMMNRTVALKVIKRDFVRKPEAVDRFRREVTAAAQLSHPNIVTAFDAEQAKGVHFLVMEYVDGIDLAQTVKDRGALSVAEACDYIRQAAIGLQHAHEQGMVHRDIKPHNLMVTDDGTVKILDFGLASLAPEAMPDEETLELRGDLTAAGVIMGTPDFISPEQAEDARSADIRSDIYSLGMTLYFLLAGRVPFGDGSATDKLKLHAEAEPTPLDQIRDDIPPRLQDVIARLTAKNPEDRFQSPQEVVDTLDGFFNDPPASPIATSASPKGKSIFKWLLGSVLVATTVAGGLFFFGGGDPQADYEKMTVFLKTGESDERAGDIAARLLRSEGGRKYLRKLDAENEQLAYTEGEFARGYTSVVAFACDDGITGVPKPKLFLKGWSLTTSGMSTRSITPSFLVKSIKFNNAPDRDCLATLEYQTPDDQRLALGLKPGSICEAEVRLDDLIQGRVSLTDVFREGTFVRAEAPEPMQGTAARQPELKLETRTVTGGNSGLPKVRTWHLSGRDVGDWKVRLWLAQNGKAKIVQEFDFEELPPEFNNQIRLEVTDAADLFHQRSVNAILYVQSPTNSRCQTTNEGKMVSIALEAPFATDREQSDLRQIDAEQQEMLLAQGYWKGDMKHGTSMESMTDATKDGTAVFLFVTLEWKPVGNPANSSPAASDTEQPPKMSVDNIVRRLSQVHGHLVPKLSSMLSEAAGVPNGQWDKFVRDPSRAADGIKSEPLNPQRSARLILGKVAHEVPPVLFFVGQ